MILLCALLIVIAASAQKIQIGADYGRAYFFYKHKDYGKGLVKAPKSNYDFLAAFTVVKNVSPVFFLESGLRFSLYEQYYSTRKYWGAWEQTYPIIHIPALCGYQSLKKFGFTVSGGIILGVMPDQYEAEYVATYFDIVEDSITRGTIYHNYTPLFPLLNLNAGLKYQINNTWEAELKTSYGKGFIKITEFDIYYNDGSGFNDQRAKQWGTGDFASVTLGIKYRLKEKRKNL